MFFAVGDIHGLPFADELGLQTNTSPLYAVYRLLQRSLLVV